MTAPPRRPDREQGMALLTVLLLVTVMSVLAVSVLDDIRFGVRRAANASEVGQAQWYAIGAEQLAAARIRRLSAASGGRILDTGGWNGRPFVFPIEGGAIRARLEDGGNCFDLNSVIEGAPGFWRVHAPGVAQFRTLMAALGVPSRDAELVAASLVDWIDVDAPDDGAYARAARPYRAGETPLAEVSELRAVQGVTPELYARLRPHLCALPPTAMGAFGYAPGGRLSPINVNTLREDQAVLVTMLTGGLLPPEEARRWIAARPLNGWADYGAFTRHPLLADAGLAGGPALLQVNNGILGAPSRFFALDAAVGYGGAEVAMSSLFEEDRGTGAVRLVARRWTPDE